MGKKQNSGEMDDWRDSQGPSVDEPASDRYEDEYAFDDGQDADLDGEADGSYYDIPFLKPMHGRKAWGVLALILVVIAVSVLYVYQAGDKKTILGNQPIPTGGGGTAAPPAGGNAFVGGALNVPMGGGSQVFQAAAIAPATGATKQPVKCPRCGNTGLPVCSSCGSVMQPLGDGSGLFACPTCGSVGIPICPNCGGHMTLTGGAGARQAAAPAGNVGGQFQCPGCGATGLPNWNPGGTPICPSCGTQMKVRSAGNPTLAARPATGG